LLLSRLSPRRNLTQPSISAEIIAALSGRAGGGSRVNAETPCWLFLDRISYHNTRVAAAAYNPNKMHVCLLAALRAFQEFTPINLLESYKKVKRHNIFLKMQKYLKEKLTNPQFSLFF
jgi:hypothetical protein